MSAINPHDMRPSEITTYVVATEKALDEITRLELENQSLKKQVNGLRLHMGWEPIDWEGYGEL